VIRRIGGAVVAGALFLILLAEVQHADEQLEQIEMQRLELARQ